MYHMTRNPVADITSFKKQKQKTTLASVAKWLEHRPTH